MSDISHPTPEQYAVAAEIIADMFTNALKAMDKGYVGFWLDNREMRLPVEEVEGITDLVAKAQFEFGWCYCGECFGDGEDDDEDDEP